MKKFVSILLVLIFVVAFIPQTMGEDEDVCYHKWKYNLDTVGYESKGASGHIKYHTVYKFCTRCEYSERVSTRAYTEGKTIVKHSYYIDESKSGESFTRINNAQHVHYYKKLQICGDCGYTKKLCTSETENHTFKNKKCTKCGAKKQ